MSFITAVPPPSADKKAKTIPDFDLKTRFSENIIQIAKKINIIPMMEGIVNRSLKIRTPREIVTNALEVPIIATSPICNNFIAFKLATIAPAHSNADKR